VNVHLADGRQLHVRPIRPDDKNLLAAGFRLLSDETRQRRFLAAKPRLTSTELRYLTEVDGRDHVALVAVEADRPTHIAAVARFVRDRERPDTAEFAIVVGDAYQGQGLGRRLGSALVGEARTRGIRRFTALTQADNVAVQKLVASIGEHLEYVPQADGTRAIVAELAA
jgi:GNAT superfamily N-acetyltransferase